MDERALLLLLWPWLEVQCRRAAATRPGLEADDIIHEVARRYLERVEDWFGGDETEASPRARARHLLRLLILHVLTEHDREVRRRGILAGPGGDDDGLGAELIPGEDVDLGEVLDARTLVGVIARLSNATYRLVFRAVEVAAQVERGEFAEAADSFEREIGEAWALFDVKRHDPTIPNDRWRWVLGEIIRCSAAWGASTLEALSTAKGWIDKNYSRARAALLSQLAREGGVA